MKCFVCKNEMPALEEVAANKIKEGRFCIVCWSYLGKLVTVREGWK